MKRYLALIAKRHEKKRLENSIRQRTAELESRENMANMLNKMSVRFLSNDEETFEEKMTAGVKFITDMMDLDNMSVFRNSMAPNGLHTSQIYRWNREAGGTTPASPELVDVPAAQLARDWEDIMSGKRIINGPVRMMAGLSALERLGVVSVFIVPVQMNNEYGGFVVFEDSINERRYNGESVEAMRSAAFLCANTVIRAEMEKKIKESLDEAKSDSRAKSEFLANMSHEIRTPMNAIIGMTKIGKSAADMERMLYCFAKIEDASKHLLGVINDILDVSKIEAGKFELALTEFDFERMLQRVVNVVSFRVDEKEQQLTVYVDKNIPRFIVGDEQRLAQIITNILGNAIKFTPQKGAICVNTYFLEEKDGVVEVKISVRDTGIGISSEQQAKLFHSFQQAESSTSNKFGGTGLGLSISKSIVEMMGGEIWVESEIGKGAVFAFTIRVKRGEQKNRAYSGNSADWKKLRILAVDDETYILKDLKGIIESFGALCDTADNAEHALQLVRQSGGYNIYFVDWKMPDMDGIELTKELKKITRAPENPLVVMISSADISALSVMAKQAGVDEFLQKPLFPSTIADIVNGYLGVSAQKPEQVNTDILGVFENHRILIAEDVEINREILLALLEQTKIEIDFAVNGAEAVRMFGEAPDKYEMIFMDVQMPEMDGYEATRQIRASGAANAGAVPIIAMTANVFKGDIERCLEAGMDGHVGKPIDLDALFEYLNRYLSDSKRDAETEDACTLGYGIVWCDSLLIGNELVDNQHKEIFKRINELVFACEGAPGSGKIEEILKFLVDYALRHFTDEELLQLEYHYPEYKKHKGMHDDFMAEINGFMRRFKESGASAGFTGELNSFLVNWLITHIQKHDKKIGDYIRGQL